MSAGLGRLPKVLRHIVAVMDSPPAAKRLCQMTTATGATLPSVYFGTMTFAWNQASSPVTDTEGSAMVQRFLSAGGVDIDTARIYSEGKCEPMLGRILQTVEDSKRYRLATKAHPSQPDGLSAKGIRAQLEASLAALQVASVDVLYLHQPDPEHDVVESLKCLSELVTEGKIRSWGISNYSAVETERICSLCKEHDWPLPSFFQGLYNPLNRLTEEELFPVLRKYGVSFIAYNPLAAGLLSGKHKPGGDVITGRFKDNPNYLPRFYTEPNHAAVARIQDACSTHGVALVPATYSWLLQHSGLDADKGDGLLLGASTVAQLEENLAACLQPAQLPAPVVEVFNSAWDSCKDGAFFYWRSYSKDQPDRESLHQGASYQAHGPKK